MRIMPVTQQVLWDEGVRAGALLKSGALVNSESEEQEEEEDRGSALKEAAAMGRIGSDYVAGKWGRFLRAPDLYFRLLLKYQTGFVRFGEIAKVRFGLKSGCDAFFMPRDVTDEIIAGVKDAKSWNNVGLMAACKRSEVVNGHVRIVRAGDNTLHPIETEYLRPEIHSLMQVDRPVVRATSSDRVVLWVNKSLAKLGGTYASKYILWGAKQTFPSSKSKSVAVPQRSTCAARPVWYDLTTDTNGVAFWPMTQKYRHIVAANPDGIVCNHRLFSLSSGLGNC
jgi:hypothetical protein